MSYTTEQLLEERIRRRQDGLTMFRAATPDTPGAPEGTPDQAEIFRCEATEMLVRGGNRSGKTTCSAALFAAIARDEPVQTWEGELIDCRRQHQKNRPLIMWLVGLQLNHIGQTLYRVLFRPGLYRIIPDEVTNSWRAFKPWDPVDVSRQHLCKPSFPLIPSSYIDPKGWSWENKAARQFTKCTLLNGTEIYAFASTSDVKQGDPVDVIWIDERIAFASHYPEWRMRLPDRKGRIFWSSKPFAGNAAMTELTTKSEEQQQEIEEGRREKADIVEFRLRFSANPFIDHVEKEKVRASLSPEELAVRDDGEYETANSLIYPYFDEKLHAAIPFDSRQDDEIAQALRENNGIPPASWCHEFVLDPGTIKPAGLFCAIPPKRFWADSEIPVLVVYDEIYGQGRGMDAAAMAHAVKEKTPADRVYHRFIIDGQAARQQQMGYSLTVGTNYSIEFAKLGLKCTESGSDFTPGDPNFENRKMVVDRHLAMRSDGRPGVRVVVERCRHFVWQMVHNHYAITSDGYVDDKRPAPKQKDDLRVCLEYWLSRRPRFVPPPKAASVSTNRWEEHQKFVRRQFSKQDSEKPYVEIGGAS